MDTMEIIDVVEAAGTIEAAGAVIMPAELADPYAFLASDRGEAWMAPILSGAYYTAWWDGNRSPYDLKFCNKLADKVLTAVAVGDCAESVLEDEFSGGQSAHDTYHQEHESDISGRLDDIGDAIDELDDPSLPEFDRDGWEEAIRQVVIDHMEENDDSSVLDMFGDYDRAEIMIRFTQYGDHVECDGYTGNFDTMVINHTLRSTLGGMGYTIADYRRMRRNPGERRNRKKGGGNGGARGGRVFVRSRPLVTEDELREIVDNAGRHFEIVLYAVVTINDLVALDMEQPLALSSYAIAAYDGMNGTYHDLTRREALVLEPGTFSLVADPGYSPADICGMTTRGYRASISNPRKD